nr:class I SAM-dependent methyltransferase [Ardenticatena sp.]
MTSDIEHHYYEYLYARGYSKPEALRAVLQAYLPLFEGYHRVADVGCGRGEFLALLEANGHEAVGVDIDPGMVETCRAQGLTAHHADAIEWLQAQPHAFDAIFSTNVVEHLPPERVQALIQAAHHALRPGGLLVIGTPNAASIVVHLHEFWRDPTHVRLYSPQLLEFFFHAAGFEHIESATLDVTRWEGIEKMLAERPRIAQHPAMWEPVPFPTLEIPSPPPFEWPKTWRGRLYSLVFPRLARWLAPLFVDIRRQLAYQQTYLQVMERTLREKWEQQQHRLIHLYQRYMAELEHYTASLERAIRWLHPPREVYVKGDKPSDEEQKDAMS